MRRTRTRASDRKEGVGDSSPPECERRRLLAVDSAASVAMLDNSVWSPYGAPAGATGDNQCQIDRPRKPRKQAKTAAAGCDQVPERFHGKEGVDGSSPSEGFVKAPA